MIDMQFESNDGNGNWDKPSHCENYKINAPGSYVLRDDTLKQYPRLGDQNRNISYKKQKEI